MHATEADVVLSRVRAEDRLGNIEADAAADLGRRHQSKAVMDVRRALVNAGDLSCPIMLQFHRFMVAVSRVSVNHDGRGFSAPDPLVWDQGSRIKQCSVGVRVNVGLAMLPGLLCFLNGPWVQVHGGCISGADIAAWPCSVSPLCKFSSFLRSLHWLAGAEDKGHFRVSYLEVLLLSEQWAGHQLLSEKVTRSHFRAHHQISISSVLVIGRS